MQERVLQVPLEFLVGVAFVDFHLDRVPQFLLQLVLLVPEFLKCVLQVPVSPEQQTQIFLVLQKLVLQILLLQLEVALLFLDLVLQLVHLPPELLRLVLVDLVTLTWTSLNDGATTTSSFTLPGSFVFGVSFREAIFSSISFYFGPALQGNPR